MNLTKDACSGLIKNEARGHYCKHGHPQNGCCYGHFFRAEDVPICLREDKNFNHERQAVLIGKWNGD